MSASEYREACPAPPSATFFPETEGAFRDEQESADQDECLSAPSPAVAQKFCPDHQVRLDHRVHPVRLDEVNTGGHFHLDLDFAGALAAPVSVHSVAAGCPELFPALARDSPCA